MHQRMFIPAIVAVTFLMAIVASAAPSSAMQLPPEPATVTDPATVAIHQGTSLWVYLIVALAASVLTLVSVWAIRLVRINSRHSLVVA